jgi:signal transduction histidine kinase
MLFDVLEARRAEVLERWHKEVLGTLVPESMPFVELVDHLPKFLDEIIDILRAEADASVPSPRRKEAGSTAADHGEQRLRLGFSLGSVVREYGALRDAIVATARAADADLTFRELQTVFDAIISGIAYAISEYAAQRDAELLRQANEHFAFVAHELRNPLSSALMALELLKQRGQLPTEGHAAGALERGLVRARDLIEQTLRIARLSSGIELRRQWTTLRALFEDAEMSARPEAEAKDVALRAVVDTAVRIKVDPRLIHSALGNLLRNAVKYTPSGGAVEVRGTVENGRAVIEVEDRCGGLPAGKVEEAFAPFVRLDSGQTGFGLGLAIARQAVDAHGGAIRVQNLPGVGCVFVLELPVVAEDA